MRQTSRKDIGRNQLELVNLGILHFGSTQLNQLLCEYVKSDVIKNYAPAAKESGQWR